MALYSSKLSCTTVHDSLLEYGDFWNIDIYPTFHSHGSVATCLMYGGIFKYGFIIHLLQSLLLILH